MYEYKIESADHLRKDLLEDYLNNHLQTDGWEFVQLIVTAADTYEIISRRKIKTRI